MAKFRMVSGSSFNVLATQPHTGHLEVAAVAETDHYPELDWHDAPAGLHLPWQVRIIISGVPRPSLEPV
jgi:hypothetical protein